MNEVQDLNIKEEILPLFDFSLNTFTKKKILEILQNPLKSTNEVISRQNILKGFIANNEILKDYSYAPIYLKEVHFFLTEFEHIDLSKNKIKYKLFSPKKEKVLYTSKFNQVVIFFYRLKTLYFSRLSLKSFPENYKPSIKRIENFLSKFPLVKYEKLIRENYLKDSHIIHLSHIISELKIGKEISLFWNDLFLFEAYLSINQGLLKQDFSFPSFVNNGINLKQLYHPFLKNPIKNDFETTNNVIVLNGANMSGKSTFLKAISLCIYFGHLGLGIPAASGQIPFLTDFSIKINKRDEIVNGYSHFMTEIVNLKKVVETSSLGNHCFAVFDELFSGTNVEDALEICKTTINGLGKFKNSYFFISTHIQELKNVSSHLVSTYYIDCKLINDTPTFTYELKEGWSDIKVGRILFDKEGLNKLLS